MRESQWGITRPQIPNAKSNLVMSAASPSPPPPRPDDVSPKGVWTANPSKIGSQSVGGSTIQPIVSPGPSYIVQWCLTILSTHVSVGGFSLRPTILPCNLLKILLCSKKWSNFKSPIDDESISHQFQWECISASNFPFSSGVEAAFPSNFVWHCWDFIFSMELSLLC